MAQPLVSLLKTYADTSLGFRAFLAHRYWHANLPGLEALIPAAGRIVDFGAGDGIVANYLGLMSPRREIIGIEKNSEKVSRGKERLPNVHLSTGDGLDFETRNADVVTLIDVLHHLRSFQEQQDILKQALSHLKPGGKLIVKEVTTAMPWKYALTTLLDHIAYPGDRFFFRHHDEIKDIVSSLGCTDVRVVDLSHFRPYAHVVVVGTKSSLASPHRDPQS